MDEPEREPPEEEKPLTTDDVLRLAAKSGLREPLDLSNRHLDAVTLRGLYLGSANFQGTSFWDSDLEGAFLMSANMQAAKLTDVNLRAANLSRANLQGATLIDVNLEGADLRRANLQGANLTEANLQRADLRGGTLWRARLARASLRDSSLEHVNWGDYLLGEEIDGGFDDAASAYRALKQWHSEAGMYDIAGEFHYREMEARRKLAWQERRLPYALAMYLLRFLYGYGERPERVIAWAAAVVFGLALVHWLFGTVAGGFLDALYYSAVSFPALGYGDWAPEPQGWAGRFLGAGESFIGLFMMALFLVTFTRKMTR